MVVHCLVQPMLEEMLHLLKDVIIGNIHRKECSLHIWTKIDYHWNSECLKVYTCMCVASKLTRQYSVNAMHAYTLVCVATH